MKIKQTTRTIVALGALVATVATTGFMVAQTAAAATCGGVQTSIIECGGTKDATNVEDTGVWNLLLLVVNIMVAGVGVLALGGIVYGSILYTSAGGNPDQVKKARTIFTSVVVGVVAFAGMYTILNFLVPGGVFN